MRTTLRVAAPILLLLIAWEMISRSGFINSALFPPPTKVILALWGMIESREIFTDLRASYVRLLGGLSAGALIGVGLGLLTGRIKFMADVISPLIQLFRPLPPVAIIPLVIVWFGIGETAKIFSIAFAVFFPVWLNAHLGAQQVPQRLLWSASTLTSSRLKIFWRVIFPASLPFIVAGMRTGIAVAFVMVFVAELMGASEGIGYEISTAHLAYRIDKMMAALAILGASGALADYLFAKAINWKYPWLRFSRAK
ncbi:MAG TPA: ABC transporter permease [Pyrinomonadaceae bacterium]|jgi:ABC-type nitrate/sulfonate/bicarbonate transport system permease component|nr:ABC transporter permease [Pyrinomonadaceae bacterium]